MSRFAGVFSQFLRPFSQVDFEKAVKEGRAERHGIGYRPPAPETIEAQPKCA